MKIQLLYIPGLIILAAFLFGFTEKSSINDCFISFEPKERLRLAKTDRLPDRAEKFRMVDTDSGEVAVSCIDGYRVLYFNEKDVPFVNLKVELSEKGSYEADQKKLLDNLKYLNARSTGMETKDLIEMKFNGYKVYGLSRNSIEQGSTLGTFVMFPGNRIVVYFYINNLKPEYRNFESVEDYKKQRDAFMNQYTKHLKDCL